MCVCGCVCVWVCVFVCVCVNPRSWVRGRMKHEDENVVMGYATQKCFTKKEREKERKKERKRKKWNVTPCI